MSDEMGKKEIMHCRNSSKIAEREKNLTYMYMTASFPGLVQAPQ